jgi:hypothetical protein
MRSNISRRLRHLEQKAHIRERATASHLRKVCQPRRAVSRARAECDEQVWELKPGETQQDFERRVRRNLRREDGPTVVIFRPELMMRKPSCLISIQTGPAGGCLAGEGRHGSMKREVPRVLRRNMEI